ncbi:hypothetical protein DCCM_3278 [Desulfocucumis palustris]|uniref:Uncharacterized protein n=1 Tax=Desulfocucumis palustris TaxID=1898651 RepID=A0A2L2XIV1_9FIRM|nr:hypothetical protein DCCM_3278 [Desulfocucumis palustris]
MKYKRMRGENNRWTYKQVNSSFCKAGVAFFKRNFFKEGVKQKIVQKKTVPTLWKNRKKQLAT